VTAMTTARVRSTRTIWNRWPSALGLLAAGSAIATGANRESVAITLVAALLCYLGAAALNRPWVAWAGIVGAIVVVTIGELAGLVWWGALGIAAVALIATGMLLRVPRPALTAQTAALLGFGGPAVVAALYLAPRVGTVLAGLALASHAIWDVVHWRRNAVVPRSLAEFCLWLDVPLGVALIVLAFTG
jgi:hypothetical protein